MMHSIAKLVERRDIWRVRIGERLRWIGLDWIAGTHVDRLSERTKWKRNDLVFLDKILD